MTFRASGYQMWMTHNAGSEKLRFPVLPELLNIRNSMLNSSVSIQGLGEVGIKQDRMALTIAFTSFFPEKSFPGIHVDPPTPPSMIEDQIKKWMKSDRPVQFLITGTPINMHFDILDFTTNMKGADVGTLHYSIMLKEFRRVETRLIEVRASAREHTAPVPVAIPAAATAARVDNRVPPRTHTVNRGDTLWSLAQRYLGCGRRYPEIANINSPPISNPNLIHIGTVLRIPS